MRNRAFEIIKRLDELPGMIREQAIIILTNNGKLHGLKWEIKDRERMIYSLVKKETIMVPDPKSPAGEHLKKSVAKYTNENDREQEVNQRRRNDQKWKEINTIREALEENLAYAKIDKEHLENEFSALRNIIRTMDVSVHSGIINAVMPPKLTDFEDDDLLDEVKTRGYTLVVTEDVGK